jgi:hypothetical protein
LGELNREVPMPSVAALEDTEKGRLAKARDDAARDDWIEMHWRAWGRMCRTLAGQAVKLAPDVAMVCPVATGGVK